MPYFCASVVLTIVRSLTEMSNVTGVSNGPPLESEITFTMGSWMCSGAVLVLDTTANSWVSRITSVPTGYTPVKGAESLAEHNKEVLDLFDRMVVALTPVFKIVAGGVGLVRGLVGDVWGLVGLARRLIRLARRLGRLVRGLFGDARRFVGQGSLVLSGRC